MRAHILLLMAIAVSACGRQGPHDEWVGRSCATAAFNTGNAQRAASSAIARALAKDNGAGISAAVMIDGVVVWRDAVGKANDTARLTPAARMRIGSVSKLFTATAAARLAEQGRLDLDAPIQRYVPSFPDKGSPITARQLAAHMSGIRQYDFNNLREANNTTHYEHLEDALGVFKNDPLLAPPSTAFNYSSFGVNLLGVAVEHAADRTYGDAINDLVVEPLGLTGTQIDDAQAHVQCRPNFYTVAFGWLRFDTFWRDSSDYYPSGGMLSTPEDLARLANTTFNSDFFTPETRALLTKPARLSNGAEIGYSFGWEVHRDARGRVDYYGHGGETNGAYATVRYYPDRRMAVAGIANYNTWLTDAHPAFFDALRGEIPDMFEQPARTP